MSLAELKEKIKDVPVSEIILNYIPLTTRGQNRVGLCPFHSDSKPSLTVNDTKGLYKCFACGAGGDAITFVEKYKNLTFVEALEECAKILGIPFEEYKKEEVKNPKSLMAQKILLKASQVYQKLGAKENHSQIFNNFVKDRGLDQTTAKEFRLGFAPSTSSISNYLESIPDESEKKFALSVATELGLIRFKNQSHYDTFRNRIMFPIWDQLGKVVGFGGRATTPEGMPKYLNSGESFHFNKRNILYGLHLAKQEIRNQDYVILVEGYMDMIALYHHGFKNTVAVMGIALSDYAINRLRNITKNFYLALDSDNAGIKAMSRMNQSLLAHGIIPKFISFDPHKDPDEFVCKLGSIELKKRIDEAKYYIDFEIQNLIPESLPEISSQKIEILNQAFPLLSTLGENLEATERVISLAKRLGLNSNPAQFIMAYQDFLAGIKPRIQQQPAVAVAVTPESEINTEKVQGPVIVPFTRLDKIIVEEIVSHPELLTSPRILEFLDFVHNVEVKTFILRLKDFAYEIDESHYEYFITNLIGTEEFTTQIREVVGASLFKFKKTELNDKVKDRLLSELIIRVNTEFLIQKKKQLKTKQKGLQHEEDLNTLMQEIIKIDKKLKNLKNTNTRTTL